MAATYGGDPADWDFFASVPVGKGVLDMPGIVKKLEAAGYDGLFAIEVDYLHPDYEDEHPAVEESVKYLKEVRETVEG